MNALQLIFRKGSADDPSLSLGVAKLSPTGDVLFVNRAAREMSGDELRVGRNIAEFNLDEQSAETLRTALHMRFTEHRGTTYHICINRPDDGLKAYLQVSALPEYDSEGRMVGSIGFLVDESIAVVSRKIHEVIQKSQDCDALMREVTRHLREIVRFDSIVITGINRERKIMRRLFEDPPPPPEAVPTVWWRMRPFIEKMVEPLHTGPLDLEEFFALPDFDDYARDDPTVAQFKARGFRKSLVMGVKYRGKLCATVALMRKDGEPFTQEDYDRCVSLPVVESVNTAIRLRTQRDQRFSSNFIQSIAKEGSDPKEIGRQLVNQLQEHHGWEHVSLFRIDREGVRLDLVCQAGSRQLPPDYSQSVNVGLLGKAFTTKKPVNVGDVRTPEAAPDFHPALAGTLSELVLPVPGTRGHWLLNIESHSRDAFADDEQEAVELQLKVAGYILENMASLELNSAIVRCVDDAVIQTNEMGVIVEANRAAVDLLGYDDSEELLYRNLAMFLYMDAEIEPETEESTAKPRDAWAVAETDAACCDPASILTRVVKTIQPLPQKLRRSDGSPVRVLLSGAELPERLGNVFIASDLRTQDRIERMQMFTNLFQQIASEIRVPLALANSFLKNGLSLPAGELSESRARELMDKSIRQVRKADLPLETVARFGTDASESKPPTGLFNLQDALNEVIAELPERDASRTVVRNAMKDVLIRAPRHELLFCVRTLLAYLLRHGAEVEKVFLSLAQRASRVMLSLTLRSPGREPVRESPREPTEFDFALTGKVIEDLMSRMGGTSLLDSRRGQFRLYFTPGS